MSFSRSTGNKGEVKVLPRACCIQRCIKQISWAFCVFRVMELCSQLSGSFVSGWGKKWGWHWNVLAHPVVWSLCTCSHLAPSQVLLLRAYIWGWGWALQGPEEVPQALLHQKKAGLRCLAAITAWVVQLSAARWPGPRDPNCWVCQPVWSAFTVMGLILRISGIFCFFYFSP